MGDMGEFFRDWDAAKKTAKEARLQDAQDMPGWKKHTDYHWSLDLCGQRLNWWPSTGRWSWKGTGQTKPKMYFGKKSDLQNFIAKREQSPKKADRLGDNPPSVAN